MILFKDDNTKENNLLYKWINASNNHTSDSILSLLSDDISIYDTICGYLNAE